MARYWTVDQASILSATSAGIQGTNQLLLHNETTGDPIPVRKQMTVVATHLYLISTTEELWTFRLYLVHENFPVITLVNVDLHDRKVIRGVYPASKGPVIYSPRVQIKIPPDHKLFAVTTKVTGTAQADFHWFSQLLVNVRD